MTVVCTKINLGCKGLRELSRRTFRFSIGISLEILCNFMINISQARLSLFFGVKQRRFVVRKVSRLQIGPIFKGQGTGRFFRKGR